MWKYQVPRERKGEFEPQLLKKNQTSISQDIKEKILSEYAKEMTTSDIEIHIRDIYGLEVFKMNRLPLSALDDFGEVWGKKYPALFWRENWANLSTYFKFPQEVRRRIYTTNAIEGFNRQLRKVTKSKFVFPTDDSLLKMLYHIHNGCTIMKRNKKTLP